MAHDKIIALISYNLHSDHMNYGAALHTYAFQQYLSKKGRTSVVIDYIPQMLEKRNFRYPILNCFKTRYPRTFVYNLLNWGILGFKENCRKYEKFQRFFTEHYNKTSKTFCHEELSQANIIGDLDIETFVCESDVIWKLYKKGGFDDMFFLNFPSATGKRKIAYSPSISSRPFTDDERKKIKRLTKDFKAISCREREGAEYLTKVLGRNVDWVLDPTLLLDDEDYSKIAIRPSAQHYLLVYNCMVNDKQMLCEAEKLSQLLGLKMIEVSNYNINNIRFQHEVKTDVGIEGWLGYFKYADFVVCNAFHGCCFSVIFKRQFFLFQRDKSDYRMKSITEGLGLSDRLVSCEDKKIPIAFNPINYNEVYKRLDALKERSFKFIQNNIL